MKYLIYFLFLLVLCGVSVGLAPVISISGQVPQLLFLAVFVWALDKSSGDYLFVAFCAGLFMDFYSGGWIGSFTLPLIFLALLIRTLVENFLVLELRPIVLAGLMLPAQVLFYLLYLLFLWVFSRLHIPLVLPGVSYVFHGFFVAFLYNLIFAYPVFLSVEYVQSLVTRFVEREYKIR